jgi:hypothetical protein
LNIAKVNGIEETKSSVSEGIAAFVKKASEEYVHMSVVSV